MTTLERVRGISAAAAFGALGVVGLLNAWAPGGGSLFAWVIWAVAWATRILGTTLFLGSALIFIDTFSARNDDLWETWLFRYMRALCSWSKISFCPAAWLTGLVAILWIFTALVWGLEVLWTGLFFFLSPVYWDALYLYVAPVYGVLGPLVLCVMLMILLAIPFNRETSFVKLLYAAFVLFLGTVFSAWSVALVFEPLRTIGVERYGTMVGWLILIVAVVCLLCAMLCGLWWCFMRILCFMGGRISNWLSGHTLLGALLSQKDAPWCPIITAKKESKRR